MATRVAEVANVHGHPDDPFDCPAFRMLPAMLQEQSREKPHLWEYLHDLRIDEIGVPEFTPTLGRAHKGMKDPNVVYPSGKGVYIHIHPDPENSRDRYNTIEPTGIPGLAQLMPLVDARLVHVVDEIAGSDDPEVRAMALLDSLEKICTPEEDRHGLFGKFFKRDGHLRVTPAEYLGLRYLIVRDKVGLGVLEPLITDPYIEDVSCSGVGPLFVEHKVFGALTSNVTFDTNEELDRFVVRLSEKIGRPVTYREPLVDAILPDGSRVNIVYGGDVSKRGSNFTIRKFSATPLSILDLIEFGALTYEMAAYLSFIMREGMNVFISGETASGKTTLLNAIAAFIPPPAKIVTIEDTPEVQLPHPNWIRESTRGASKDSSGSAVTMMDLLKSALRQRPNEIIIGEIRGEEGAVAFQAMQTGHACMATFHAATVEKLIQRLTGAPINIPKVYIDNLNVVVICSAVRLPNGKEGRRVISISEIIGYDSISDSFSFIEVFKWNPVTDEHEFVAYNNSYLLERVIAPKRGMAPKDVRNIYTEMEQRATVLRSLAEQKFTDFYDFFNVLSKAYREGLFR
ncbi:MAG: type II/IV secretion system ATPase subunit [Chloroflexi bacterium]|nr:type II/IV secretion system ATPase subunit [Chloroflexota bacterium]MCI0877670.1 type II/IV secretion system ATPase subunit [Chloroflexota bacterium]